MILDDAKQVGTQEDLDHLISRRRYRKMVLVAVLSVSSVAIVPFLIMSTITYNQYQEAFRSELTRPMLRFAAAGKLSIESYLSERQSALAMVTREETYDELGEAERLSSLLANLNQTFGGVIDIGLINEEGTQTAFAGPREPTAVNYANEDWFRAVSDRGAYVSEVFRGFRDLPHIIVAIRHDDPEGHRYVLRVTIDTDAFHWLVRARSARRPEQDPVCRRCHSLGVQPFSDAFIINAEGILQSSSRLYGEVLEPTPLPQLPYSRQAELVDLEDEQGEPLIVSYAHIENSPFTLVVLSPRVALHAGWLPLRRDLLVFPAASVVLILAVVIWGSIYTVSRVRDADTKRAALYHKIEYSNKMAAIGRLGAGVAHEINNPLSIITQKAGLLKDLLTLSEETPAKDKLMPLLNSVLKSAERCGSITHRLLGFAKHMEVQWTTIDLDELLREVLEFLEKEATYREIRVVFMHSEPPPPVVSDRGQLQQVFLNIVNNAFAAVDEGGRIDIEIEKTEEDSVAVSITDDGVGIPEDEIAHIFDPFFTTKKGAGTGLGLSITYGIVQKLGGQITVKSKVGQGTCFTVTLPMRRAHA